MEKSSEKKYNFNVTLTTIFSPCVACTMTALYLLVENQCDLRHALRYIWHFVSVKVQHSPFRGKVHQCPGRSSPGSAGFKM